MTDNGNNRETRDIAVSVETLTKEIKANLQRAIDKAEAHREEDRGTFRKVETWQLMADARITQLERDAERMKTAWAETPVTAKRVAEELLRQHTQVEDTHIGLVAERVFHEKLKDGALAVTSKAGMALLALVFSAAGALGMLVLEKKVEAYLMRPIATTPAAQPTKVP